MKLAVPIANSIQASQKREESPNNEFELKNKGSVIEENAKTITAVFIHHLLAPGNIHNTSPQNSIESAEIIIRMIATSDPGPKIFAVTGVTYFETFHV
ncbi:MAG: hypothetical protein E3J72_19570 [Planctomycetota bacterium]|nr:MAG: hypothetical protein E3J72_19570 [Planctomycetota bacterium]